MLISCLAVHLRMEKQQEPAVQTEQSLRAELAVLHRNLAGKDAEIAALRFQNDQLIRLIFGSKRERFIPAMDARQLVLDFEPEAAEIEAAVAAELEVVRVEYERAKPKKAHQGRTKLPDHLPVIETVIEPEEDTAGMVCIGREVTDELDYTPAKLHINRIIRPKYITPEDAEGKQQQVIAELDRPIAKCTASAALLAMIFTDKFIYHLPLYRTLQRIAQMGVPLPSSTLDSWVRLTGDLLRPLHAAHALIVKSEIYQMIDESPIKVQDRDTKGACHQGYMWVRYAPLSKSVLFEYYKTRSTNGPLDDLPSFKGFLQTDGYSGYTYLAAQQGVTHLSCWAHARRYFEKALKNDSQRASHVMQLIQVLYKIEALARESAMAHQKRFELRLEKSLPVINEIGRYIHQERNSATPKSPMGIAFEYCANRWTSLQNYLTNGMLEIDSNLVENSIRPLALGRKNYLFAGSQRGAEDIAMIYSFFGTCKANTIDPQKWLVYVIKNINGCKPSRLKYLLPQFIDPALM